MLSKTRSLCQTLPKTLWTHLRPHFSSNLYQRSLKQHSESNSSQVRNLVMLRQQLGQILEKAQVQLLNIILIELTGKKWWSWFRQKGKLLLISLLEVRQNVSTCGKELMPLSTKFKTHRDCQFPNLFYQAVIIPTLERTFFKCHCLPFSRTINGIQ